MSHRHSGHGRAGIEAGRRPLAPSRLAGAGAGAVVAALVMVVGGAALEAVDSSTGVAAAPWPYAVFAWWTLLVTTAVAFLVGVPASSAVARWLPARPVVTHGLLGALAGLAAGVALVPEPAAVSVLVAAGTGGGASGAAVMVAAPHRRVLRALTFLPLALLLAGAATAL